MDHRSLSERYVKKHISLQLIVYSLFSYFYVTLLAYSPVLPQAAQTLFVIVLRYVLSHLRECMKRFENRSKYFTLLYFNSFT